MAILNIQIPQIMGSAVNVIAKFSETKDGELFMEEMKVPALKLIGMYLAQVGIKLMIINLENGIISFSLHAPSFTYICYPILVRVLLVKCEKTYFPQLFSKIWHFLIHNGLGRLLIGGN